MIKKPPAQMTTPIYSGHQMLGDNNKVSFEHMLFTNKNIALHYTDCQSF